jgi:Domain of unknown function (DUF5076)
MRQEDPVELDIPDGVASAGQSVEVLRAWIADGSLMVSLNADAFGDRVADWGRLLSEIGHHIAKAAELNGHMPYDEGLQALQQGFGQHLSTGQPAMSGKLRGRKSH